MNKNFLLVNHVKGVYQVEEETRRVKKRLQSISKRDQSVKKIPDLFNPSDEYITDENSVTQRMKVIIIFITLLNQKVRMMSSWKSTKNWRVKVIKEISDETRETENPHINLMFYSPCANIQGTSPIRILFLTLSPSLGIKSLCLMFHSALNDPSVRFKLVSTLWIDFTSPLLSTNFFTPF